MKKKIPLIIIFILIISLLIIAYIKIQISQSSENISDKQAVILFADDRIPVIFQYPAGWKIIDVDTFQNNAEYDKSHGWGVSIGNDDFNISIGESLDNNIVEPSRSQCQPFTPCNTHDLVFSKDDYAGSYQKKDFEEVGRNLYVPIEGGSIITYGDNAEKQMVSNPPKLNATFYVFEKVNDRLITTMSILDHTNPADYIEITYKFKTKNSFMYWNDYKKTLTGIVKSLKLKD